MNGRKLTTLTVLTAVLGVGELANSIAIGLGKDPGGAGFSAAFGVLFLVAAWLLRKSRITAGAILAGVLCLFELLEFPSWPKTSVGEWIVTSAFAALSVAGLISVIVVLAARMRRRAAA
jgi:hypothetical protein